MNTRLAAPGAAGAPGVVGAKPHRRELNEKLYKK